MDIRDFIKNAKRMCNAYDGSCNGCPGNLSPKEGCIIQVLNAFDIRGAEIEAVENWAKAHPLVTNRQKVEEVFGSESKILIAMPSNWLDLEYFEPKCKEENEDETNS